MKLELIVARALRLELGFKAEVDINEENPILNTYHAISPFVADDDRETVKTAIDVIIEAVAGKTIFSSNGIKESIKWKSRINTLIGGELNVARHNMFFFRACRFDCVCL